jgi:hypothetical protein
MTVTPLFDCAPALRHQASSTELEISCTRRIRAFSVVKVLRGTGREITQSDS